MKGRLEEVTEHCNEKERRCCDSTETGRLKEERRKELLEAEGGAHRKWRSRLSRIALPLANPSRFSDEPDHSRPIHTPQHVQARSSLSTRETVQITPSHSETRIHSYNKSPTPS
jgi:hypothetical protein